MKDKTKKRIKELEEMIEVVLLSIPREVASQKFYQKAAERASSDTTVKFFKSLMAEETGHEAHLRKVLKEFQTELKQLKRNK